jgi:NAD(P)H dehydrogenase (quinone)
MSTPAIFVFGATGSFGRPLVDELLPDHKTGRIKLIASARKSESVAALKQLGVVARQIDLDKAEMDGLEPLIEALRGVDSVYLLTGYEYRMLAQSKAVIDAAKAAGVAHIVHLGANGRQDTTSVYSAWHRLIEAYIETSGLSFTHLRPCQTFQTLPMMHAIAGSPGVVEGYIGDTRIAWVDTRDVAAVAAAALRNPSAHAGRSYPLATVQASMPEVVDLLSQITGKPWRYADQEPGVFASKAAAGGGDPIYLGSVSASFAKQRQGLLPVLSEVYDNVKELTGRDPIGLRAYVEQHLEMFKA